MSGATERKPETAAGFEGRYRTLDAWRGLACLMVVVHHAGYALSGSETLGSWGRWLAWLAVRRAGLGVSLFFVISGYCIAASADASARRGDPPGAFLSRRFWRIYPPYWAALLGFAAAVVGLEAAGVGHLCRGPLGVVLDPPGALDWRQWLGNLTLTETWRPHLGGPDRNVYTAVAWSLCFEEQFYFVCFLALWLAPGRLFTALGLATAAAGAVRVAAWWAGLDAPLAGTFPLLWHEFAVGLAVYYRLNRARSRWEKRACDLALAGLCAGGLLAASRGTATAAGFGLVLIALAGRDAWTDGLAVLASLRACGRRCYSIYLAHLPAGVVVNQFLYERGLTGFWSRTLVMVPLSAAAGLASGWAFHAVVESRFLAPPPAGARPATHPRRRRSLSAAPPVAT